ncbi:hypothetical protein TRIP_C20842 [Candidatus Zixiibacteriota bacterium]|nr:hypothetical protein TRIP_C20842 [candidate division Zixibacteria bacterium]
MFNNENLSSPAEEPKTPASLSGRSIVIDSPIITEDQAEYNSLLASLEEEFLPQTSFQHYLVRKIANNIWRSLRLYHAETCTIRDRLDSYQAKLEYPIFARLCQVADANIGLFSIPKSSDSAQILRDEMRLDRQLARTINLLRKSQQMHAKYSRKSRPATKMRKKYQKMGPPFVSEKRTQSHESQLPADQHDNQSPSPLHVDSGSSPE